MYWSESTSAQLMLLHICCLLTIEHFLLSFLLTGWGSFIWMYVSGRQAGRFRLHRRRKERCGKSHRIFSEAHNVYCCLRSSYLSFLARLILWISEADNINKTCPFADTPNVHNTLRIENVVHICVTHCIPQLQGKLYYSYTYTPNHVFLHWVVSIRYTTYTRSTTPSIGSISSKQ